jgi:hypothetical protein
MIFGTKLLASIIQIFFQSIFCLSLYSVLSHLDILTHRSLFNDIEPICLGWLFQKIEPKNFQYKDGKFTKTSKHKAIWTNPSRSLLTLMATFAALKLGDENLYLPWFKLFKLFIKLHR